MAGHEATVQLNQQLERVTRQLISQGARVEAAAENHALLAFGGQGMKAWMHALHALMTFGTLGLWSAAWAIHWARSRNWRRLIVVDEAGRLTGSVWKAGRNGALPAIGPVVSREGIVTFEAGKRSVAFDPGLATNQVTRIAVILLTDPGSGVVLRLIDNQWKIRVISLDLSVAAREPVRAYWFALS